MSTWMLPDAWAALKRGDGCVLCEDASWDINVFGSKIADLNWSWFRLANNQFLPGWTVVTLRRHATELYQLAPDELAGYWADVPRAAKTLDRVFRPAKINYLVMGNICPHIHCHLVPRFYTDDPGWAINMNQEQILLPPDEYASRLEALRLALAED